MVPFGLVLKDLRTERGISQSSLSRKLGIQTSNLSSMEAGRLMPWRSQSRLEKIARILNLQPGTLDWFRFWTAAYDYKKFPPDIIKCLASISVYDVLCSLETRQNIAHAAKMVLSRVRRSRYLPPDSSKYRSPRK